MSLARAAVGSPLLRRAPSPASDRPTRPFVRVELCEKLDDARLPWLALALEAEASPYQSFAFASVWFAAVGAAQGATPLIVVARDDAGAPVALLPLARGAKGPLRFAGFLGGKDFEFQPRPVPFARRLDA